MTILILMNGDLRKYMLITAFADQMSSQLTNLVPMLDGTNYQQWYTAMESFLMSQGLWKCMKEGADTPTITTTTTAPEVEGGPSTSVTAGKEELTLLHMRKNEDHIPPTSKTSLKARGHMT